MRRRAQGNPQAEQARKRVSKTMARVIKMAQKPRISEPKSPKAIAKQRQRLKAATQKAYRKKIGDLNYTVVRGGTIFFYNGKQYFSELKQIGKLSFVIAPSGAKLILEHNELRLPKQGELPPE